MKTKLQSKNLKLLLVALTFMLFSVNGFAQACTGNQVTLSIQNITNPTNTTLEFDLYIKNTGSTTLKFVAWGGNVRFPFGMLEAGSLQEVVTQPSAAGLTNIANVSLAALNIGSATAQGQIRWSNAPFPSEANSFPMTPMVDYKFCRIKLTNTVAWNNYTAQLILNQTTAGGAQIQTVNVYCNGNFTSTALTTTNTFAVNLIPAPILLGGGDCFTSATATTVAETCLGANDGSATITVSPIPSSSLNATYNLDGAGYLPVTLTAGGAFTLSGLSAGSHSLSLIGDGTCTTPVTVTPFTIAAGPAPVTPTFTQVAPICAGATLAALPTVSTNTITGTWAPALDNMNTTTYTFTPDIGQCASTTTMTITVNQPPSSTITGGGVTVCQGTTVTLSAPAGADSYQWVKRYIDSQTGTIEATLGTANTQDVTSSGIYFVTVTTNGCSSTSSTTIIVADNVFNGTLAAGDASQTGRLNRFAAISTCALPKACPGTFTTTGARLYDSYTITNPSATAACATIGVTSACGTNIFSAAYDGSYNPTALCTNYLGDPGSSFPTTSFYQVTVPANGSVVVVVHEVNVGAGCTGYTLTVDMPRIPAAVVASNPTPNCGDNVTLTASTASSYLWSPGGATTPAITVTASDATTYTVTLGYGNNSCTATASSTVTGATVTPTFTQVAPICAGATLAALPTVSTNTITGTWAPAINNTTTTTYTFTPDAGQCALTATMTITVNQPPPSTITGGSVTVCQGTTVTLSAPAGADSYQWVKRYIEIATGPIEATLGTANTQAVTSSGIYFVTATTNGCSSTTSTFVNVADNVYNGTIATGDATQTGRLNRFAAISTCALPKACPGTFTTTGARLYDSYTITNPSAAPACATIGINSACANNIFSVAYNGSFSPTALCTNYLGDPGSSAAVIYYQVTVPANGSVEVVVHEVNVGAGCTGYTLTVDMPRIPAAIVASNPTPNCGDNVTLTASAASSYLWSPGGATTPAINVTAGAAATYSVTLGYGNNSCTATASSTVTAATTTNGSVTTSICAGGSYVWPLPDGTGATYTTAQTNLTNTVGCNTATLNLTITPLTTNGSVTTSICAGGSYVWPLPNGTGATYTTAQTNLTNTVGCNTATLNLTITPLTTNGSVTTSICAGDSYVWPLPNGTGATYTTAQTNLTNTVGCNTATLNLTVNTAPTPTGNAVQTFNVANANDATIANLVVSPAGVIWYGSLANAQGGINPLPSTTVLVSGNTYWAVNTVGACSSTPFAVTVTVTLGSEEFNNLNFTFYPNPTSSVLNISYSENISDVQVMNLLGQEVMKKKTDATEVQIDLSTLAEATYFVKVTSQGRSKIFKVIKRN